MVENNREYPKRRLRERDWKRAINQRMFFFTYYAALLGKICEKKALEKILVANKLIMVDKILILISAFYYFRISVNLCPSIYEYHLQRHSYFIVLSVYRWWQTKLAINVILTTLLAKWL